VAALDKSRQVEAGYEEERIRKAALPLNFRV